MEKNILCVIYRAFCLYVKVILYLALGCEKPQFRLPSSDVESLNIKPKSLTRLVV